MTTQTQDLAVEDKDSYSPIVIRREAAQCASLVATMTILQKLTKQQEEAPARSRQDDEDDFQVSGDYFPDFDMASAKKLKRTNTHHSTCIGLKRDATVGMGFVDEKVREQRQQVVTEPDKGTSYSTDIVNPVLTKTNKVLDPLCDFGILDVLKDVAEDYWDLGNGYIEVVRKNPKSYDSPIVGLYHIPAECVHVYRWGGHRYHYVIMQDGQERHWPRFGRVQEFLRSDSRPSVVGSSASKDTFSEVIHFRGPSADDPYFGVPSWLSAVSDMELLTGLKQFMLDFFHNRGVPEFVLLVKGQLSQKQWDSLKTTLVGHAGLGNSHKSVAVKMDAGEDNDIKVIRLAMDNFNGTEQFRDMTERTDMAIVSAHRVPPVLAGILIPGKLGATNEIPNALAAFQALLIGPAQFLFQTTLARTLGNPSYNGGLALKAEDFEFRRLTDVIDPGTLDVVSRMRQTVPEANAEGRDLADGLRD